MFKTITFILSYDSLLSNLTSRPDNIPHEVVNPLCALLFISTSLTSPQLLSPPTTHLSLAAYEEAGRIAAEKSQRAFASVPIPVPTPVSTSYQEEEDDDADMAQSLARARRLAVAQKQRSKGDLLSRKYSEMFCLQSSSRYF